MNILETVLDEMQSDDRNTLAQSKKLTTLYGTQDKDGQELLDAAFICLCGWSLKTLINGNERI